MPTYEKPTVFCIDSTIGSQNTENKTIDLIIFQQFDVFLHYLDLICTVVKVSTSGPNHRIYG